jgi:hypothetical protein
MRLISSPFAWVHKRILPVGVGVVFLLVFVGAVFGAVRANQPALAFFPLLATVWFFIWWYVIHPLADLVWLDESDLVVRKGGLEERVPLSGVEKVEQSYFTNPERLTLHLAAPGPLGDKIVFLPPIRYFRMPFSTHPLAEELRDLVRQHTHPELHRP